MHDFLGDDEAEDRFTGGGVGCDVALWDAEGADVGHVFLGGEASMISCLGSGAC
jgi:hypothetical protein